MHLRPLELRESLHLLRLGIQVRDTIDRQAGQLLLAVAGGDDAALAPLHDRLIEIGRQDIADGLRNLIGE